MILSQPSDFKEFCIEHAAEFDEEKEEAEKKGLSFLEKEKWLQAKWEGALGYYIDCNRKESREELIE